MSDGNTTQNYGPSKGAIPMSFSPLPFNTAALVVNGVFSFTNNGVPALPNATVDGPLSFQFTNAFISCVGTGACPDLTINLQALVILSDPLTDASALLGLDGSTSSSLVNIQGNVYDPSNGSISVSFPPIVILPGGPRNPPGGNETIPVAHQFNQTAPLSNIVSFGLNETIFMQLTVSGLTAGANVSLPSSFFYAVTADPNVPEPGTVLIVAGGLLGAIWLRRRML